MRLWLLKPHKDYELGAYNTTDSRYPRPNPFAPWYDKVFGYVIRAEDGNEARQIAATRSGDNVWLQPEYTFCIELTSDGEKGMVLADSRDA